MKKLRLPILLALACLVVMLLSLTVSAAPQNGWYQENGDWYYYRNGEPVANEVLVLGGVRYGFLWDGRMLDDYESDWIGEYAYRAKPGGALMTNQWYEAYGSLYYYGADGRAPQDFCVVDGTEYYFHADGCVFMDGAVYSGVRNGMYAISQDGTQNKALDKEGWNQAFGEWYYIRSGALLYDEVLVLGANRFYINGSGQMVADDTWYFWNGEREIYGYFDANGYLKTGWFKVGNDWAYADSDGNLYLDGVYEIGGQLYLFEDYIMCNRFGEYEGYYITASGALLRNKWYQDTTGSAGGVGWAYYDNEGRRAYGLQQIGGVYYYFEYNGIMVTNEVCETDEGIMVFDKDGKGTVKNGWFLHPETGEDMYAYNGGLPNGPLKVGTVTYGFSYGTLMKNCEVWGYDSYSGMNAHFLCDANGRVIQTLGWHKVGAYWYYVKQTSGALAEGFLTLGGKTYYMNPEMLALEIVADEAGTVYVADKDGVCTKLSGNGLTPLYGGLYYLENGKMIREAWRSVGGKWYYFSAYGDAARYGTWEIDGKLYIFNDEGVMVTNAWYGQHYADQNGIAKTGLATIGGKQYLFDDGGWLCTSGMYTYGGTRYLIGPDGLVLGTAAKQGWNQIGSDWYYVNEEGELLSLCLFTQGSVTYGFDENGRMCTNGVRYAWFDYYIFDANGKVLTGWQKIDGKWYYAPNNDDPVVYENRVAMIGGKEYVFKYNYMEVGTFVFEGTIYTTNASGVVISKTKLPDGWTYSDGDVLYRKNGAPYTGWVGDYYVEDGCMLYDQRIQYGDKFYYLGQDGRYLKNGLYEVRYGDLILAKADGTLHCNGWYQYGKNWYYFDNAYALRGYDEYIDGAWQIFDENGVWQGSYTEEEDEYPALPSGWHQIDGEWYYYLEGVRQYGSHYINGAFYYFDYADGAMRTNSFDLWEGFYYGADGKQTKYTGWKQIAGDWVYFDNTYRAISGWIPSGSGWYYTEYIYNEDMGAEYPVMMTNIGLTRNGRLYHFGANGYCAGYVNKSGWYQIGSDWYYLENGYVAEGYRVIDGAGYYFYSDGMMAAGECMEALINGKRCNVYFGTDGRQITKDGWRQTAYGWIYIQNGEVLYEGIYKIGGREYYFRYGYWVE